MEYKTCSKCSINKPLEDYWKAPRSKDGKCSWCKSCVSIGMRNHARMRKQEAIKQLGGKCSQCGGLFHPAAYDFHHIDPTEKETGIARLLQSYAIEHPKVQQELEKCVLLCANCHRTLHASVFDENIDRACVSGVCGV